MLKTCAPSASTCAARARTSRPSWPTRPPSASRRSATTSSAPTVTRSCATPRTRARQALGRAGRWARAGYRRLALPEGVEQPPLSRAESSSNCRRRPMSIGRAFARDGPARRRDGRSAAAPVPGPPRPPVEARPRCAGTRAVAERRRAPAAAARRGRVALPCRHITDGPTCASARSASSSRTCRADLDARPPGDRARQGGADRKGQAGGPGAGMLVGAAVVGLLGPRRADRAPDRRARQAPAAVAGRADRDVPVGRSPAALARMAARSSSRPRPPHPRPSRP